MALDVYTHNIYTCIWVRRINVETMMMKEVWTKAKLTQQNKTNPFVSGAAHIGAKYRNLSACLFRDRFRCFLSLILQGFFIGKIFPEFVQFNTPQQIIQNSQMNQLQNGVIFWDHQSLVAEIMDSIKSIFNFSSTKLSIAWKLTLNVS